MREFEYRAPTSLDEAIGLLRANGDGARALAGGTDLVVQMKENATKFPPPSQLISLHRISEIKGIEFSEKDGLRIGAGATMTDVAASQLVRARFQAVAEGASVVGSIQTMNMATVGGNLCNAAPSADIAPALLAFEGEAVIVGPSGRRTVPLAEFFAGPGRTVLAADDLLAEVRVKTPAPSTGSAYARHTPRKQMDIAVVGVGVVLTLAGKRIERARVALGAVAPTPIRVTAVEKALEGQAISDELFAAAAAAAASECSPISDVRGSAEFRRHLVRVMTERILRLAAERARRDG